MTSLLAEAQTPSPLEALSYTVDEALAVLDEERDAFLNGAYDTLEDISARKLVMIERIEAGIRSVPRSDGAVDMIRRVIEAGRRNEQIIMAARQGLAYARRRIGQIRETARGAVAYAQDGSQIASRADLMGDTTSF